MKISQAIKLATIFANQDIPVFFSGSMGIGKSALAMQICQNLFGAVNDECFCDFRAILRDPTDVKGVGFPNRENGTTEWLRPADLPFIGNDNFAEQGILFLDELLTAPDAMQKILFGLVYDRKAGPHTLKPGWRIFGAGNRVIDKSGAQRMLAALANRWAHIDIEADANDWCEWADNNDVEPLMVAFIRFRPELLHKMPANDERAFPTPRSVTMAAKSIENVTDTSMRLQLVSAMCGQGFAAEFEGFARTYASLPSLESITVNPMSADIPSETSALYAVSVGLARKATAKTWPNIAKYAARLPKEFEVVLMQSAAKRDKALSHSKVYTDWISKNHNVLI